MKYTIKLLAVVGALLVMVSTASSQASISLERVNGLAEPGVLEIGNQIFFTFRVQNSTDEYAIGVTSGFRVYSPDGADWSITTLDTTPEMGRGVFPMGVYLSDFSVTGTDADTVGLLGLGENIGLPTGLPPGYDDLGLIVRIGPIPHESRGLTICLDSSFYYNGGYWKWVLEAPSEIIPSWDGPHCYTIECCENIGDVNDDGAPDPDISDLIFMVTYMFQGGEAPFCPKVMDVDGSGGIPDIADLTYLVAFMFQEGPETVALSFPTYGEITVGRYSQPLELSILILNLRTGILWPPEYISLSLTLTRDAHGFRRQQISYDSQDSLRFGGSTGG